MFTWKTSEGTSIKLIKVGITNCYFFEKDGTRFLIDTGQKREATKLKNQLINFLKPNYKLDYLILTHSHYDHAENARMIQQIFSPKVVVHKAESQFLKNGFTTLPRGTNFLTDFISRLGNKYARSIGEYDALSADFEVDHDNPFINIEGVSIIHTPGHTIGSLTVVIDNEIAIVGDTLFGIFRNKILPPFADSRTILFESWEKLTKTSCKKFLPAHGKVISKEQLIENFNKFKRGE